MQTGHRRLEREITDRTNLCLPDGRLSREAVGWSRTPLHHTNIQGRGRTMRWEYWCVVTPTHLFAITASSLDYLSSKGAWCQDRRTQVSGGSRSPTAAARAVCGWGPGRTPSPSKRCRGTPGYG